MAAALEFFVSTTNMNDDVYTIAEAAKAEKVSEDTIRREMTRGNLPAYRIGRSIRIKHADLIRARRPVVGASEPRGGEQVDAEPPSDIRKAEPPSDIRRAARPVTNAPELRGGGHVDAAH